MLYKTPQKLDAKVLSFAKKELVERQKSNIVYYKLILNIMCNLFLSNFKNSYQNIKRTKYSTLYQLIINITVNLIRFIMPASTIFIGHLKTKH